jgi:hypothetical protein
MSFNIERQNDTRKVKTEVSGVEGTDNVNVRRDPFVENPEKHEEPGMDFLLGEEDEDDEEEEENLHIEDEDSGEVPLFEDDNVNNSGNDGKSYEDVQKEKSFYLSQLKRLEKKGNVISRRYTMEHSLDEIRGEVIRIKREQEMDVSIDYLRQGLMFCVSTIEMADNKYNFGAELGGWSQNVMGNIETYDGVFEELYDKYSSSISVMPEIKLISMLAGSAFMYSLQKKIAGGAKPTPPRQREMSGPSIDTDELMKSLGEIDLDDVSSVSSSEASIKIKDEEPVIKTISIAKKRGRPPKK